MTYIVKETQERVGDGRPDFRTSSYRRAMRRRDKLNAGRILPTYRYEVVKASGWRCWHVVAFQNRAVPS